MNRTDRKFIQRLVAREAGIELGDSKQYLIESRLSQLADREGYSDLESLVSDLRIQSNSGLTGKVVGSLTTNESYFFRDDEPFEVLRNVILPELYERRTPGTRVNIWSGACARGQEPYSVAMLLCEYFSEQTDYTRLLATDISDEMLRFARLGAYGRAQIERGLPRYYRTKYFDKSDQTWSLSKQVSELVECRKVNLTDSLETLRKMDLVLLRYVLTYFDDATKESVLHKVREQMKPGAYLLLGGTEMVMNIDFPFEIVRESGVRYYRRPPDN